MTHLRTLAALLLVLVPAAASLGQATERYFVMMLGGERAGWMRETVTEADDRITTAAVMEMAVKRGPIEISITIETEFVETADHEPVSMRARQVMGSMPIETAYRFTDDGVEVSTTQGGRTTTSTQPAPQSSWMTPSQAADRMAESLEAGDAAVSVTVLDPAIGLTPVTTSRFNIEPASIEVLGKVVPGYRAASTTSIAPGTESVEYLSPEGDLLRSVTGLGGLEIEIIAADRELATADIEAPEMMRSTFITPDRTIKSPRATTRGVYLLTAREGTLADLPETSSQSVERIDARTLRVTVSAEAVSDAGAPPTDADLASSIMIACTDEAVVALVERSGAKETAPVSVRAEAHRRFVHGYIDEKSLGVGFATASEVARTRVGDCSEHATLLAAVLRADGIPSRVVSGLVYARDFIGSQDIFGYHMWTQAYIDTPEGPRWVDLDATLPNGIAYDATHIALDVSALSDDDTINAMIALAPLMGRLDIAIEAVE